MGKDRIVILLCILLTIGFFTAAGSLMPRINHMRADLQLTVHDEVMQNLPPKIAITQAALGSFRGLAVDVLWGRVQRMQADGNLYEAMQLADWITKLQPRFTQVWVFHAWNMAYNISVTTATEQERWMWVYAGVRLLRDEAIPLNPQNVQLHRELGWIFLNKIGGYSDDMHWHYKTEIAMEWQRILSEPPRHATTDEVVAWFEPVAVMYEAYVNERELGFAVREEIDQLVADSELFDVVDPFYAMTIQQLNTRLITLSRRRDEVARRLAPLHELVREQIRQAQADPVDRFRRGEPEAAVQLDRLRERGFRTDRSFLRRIAQLELRQGSVDLQLLNVQLPDLSETDQWLHNWLTDEAIAEERERILGFTRARVIRDEHRMDPIWMHELMRGEWFTGYQGEPLPIPLDWRHPAAHGMYWSTLGVRRSVGLIRPQDFMVLNTDRQITHSLQSLTRTGNIIFDPATRYYRVMPDARYIDAYHANVLSAEGRLASQYVQDTAAPESFQAGHENFLAFAVQTSYFYGDMEQAHRYYRMLRELYSDFRPDRAARYQQSLEEFVISYYVAEDGVRSHDDALSSVTGFITRAIDEGFVAGRREVSNRYLELARRTHQIYNDYRLEASRSSTGDRLSLPNFNEMLIDTFTRYLLAPGGPPEMLISRGRAWQGAPTNLRLAVYDRIREPLQQQAQQRGFSFDSMFPAPDGLAEYRARRGQDEAEQRGPLQLDTNPLRR